MIYERLLLIYKDLLTKYHELLTDHFYKNGASELLEPLFVSYGENLALLYSKLLEIKPLETNGDDDPPPPPQLPPPRLLNKQ